MDTPNLKMLQEAKLCSCQRPKVVEEGSQPPGGNKQQLFTFVKKVGLNSICLLPSLQTNSFSLCRLWDFLARDLWRLAPFQIEIYVTRCNSKEKKTATYSQPV